GPVGEGTRPEPHHLAGAGRRHLRPEPVRVGLPAPRRPRRHHQRFVHLPLPRLFPDPGAKKRGHRLFFRQKEQAMSPLPPTGELASLPSTSRYLWALIASMTV